MPIRVIQYEEKYYDWGDDQFDVESCYYSNQLKFCYCLLQELLRRDNVEYAWPFYHPVDALRSGYKDYYEIVKHPMCLDTIRKKFVGYEYNTPEEFAADVKLIFTNCYLYFPPNHENVDMARELQHYFEELFEKMPSEDSPFNSHVMCALSHPIGVEDDYFEQSMETSSGSSSSSSSSSSSLSDSDNSDSLDECEEFCEF